ncbi:MAG: 30S ribosomal protein S7 [Candidatus Diapherotrites archaeon ADurb.Bin253]|jgi:small subunit ribosomal protein S7|nr:MAG: 30S ribosomal protein S7 [Candidatus Diapherotrites archaeon ADurb.Bin253]HNZ52019.1 30S ribosomal protein S7 [Candidatus Pacearchaeota archaeon]HOC96785.1 30S ribosomal protein S7 [Candidatus Pacearchaeota archaeon]HOH04101.1 30S ribosomal protein S7 [Candidatus Pacearchaeota archaeon]HOU79325.1 30S ribosomal protein S7 [Candidatus Pacearchaeota archaeon]
MSEQTTNLKIFDKYDISTIQIQDEGLKSAINLKPKLVLKNQGRGVGKFSQTKVNIVERLMNKISVAGHRGKKHRLEKGNATGKYTKNMKITLDVLEIIEKKTNKNPVEVLVRAVENSAPRDETTVIEYGGARYPQAVDVSPVRRVNLALKHLVHGASDKAFNKKKTITQTLAEEIIMAAENNGESLAVRKKKESEAQADSAR